MVQKPEPGSSVLLHRGGTLTFTLDVPDGRTGQAWLRTNLGRAAVRRREIIEHVEAGSPLLARDWHDIAMRPVSDRRFELTVAVSEVGCFEAKCLFLPQGASVPFWPEGPNTRIKVEPAGTVCGNTIYTAFVRQFRSEEQPAIEQTSQNRDAVERLDKAGYTVIPPSGTFRSLIRRLDFIFGTLRCDILQLLPIHPTPTTYARMGRYGSPFAGLDFMDVDPSLAEFDRRTTPMDQFRELADAVHARHARIFLDIPINHTGWASALQIHHPEWFARNEDRSFQSPGAWGVTWEDLARLDYRVTSLWTYMADVFLYWCRQGVDGFRCDAGYMIPAPVWTYIVAKVRDQYPETAFLLEGLGGHVHVMEQLLRDAGMNWAYSELFQSYDRDAVTACLNHAFGVSSGSGLLVHFAETHDNPRLAATSPTYARQRTALAALCSQSGGFGLTAGVEWFARDKVDVHGAPSLSWDATPNQVAEIRRLNTVLAVHPCMHAGSRLALIHRGEGNAIALRRTAGEGRRLLVLANLDAGRPATVAWQDSDFPADGGLTDLLTGRPAEPRHAAHLFRCALEPGQVLCLTPDPTELPRVEAALADAPPARPPAAVRQELRAMALDAWCSLNPGEGLGDADADRLAADLAEDPGDFCRRIARGAPLVTRWSWPRDLRRVVMLPPGHFLLLQSPHPFVARLCDTSRVLRFARALRKADGSWFAILPPLPTPDQHRRLTLEFRAFHADGPGAGQGEVLLLADADSVRIALSVSPPALREGDLSAIGTNGRNALGHVRAAWGATASQYDAMLAANLDPEVPVDRHVMLTRCRAWVVNRGYSQEIGLACTDRFAAGLGGGALWRFTVPVGMGRQVTIEAAYNLVPGRNESVLEFRRLRATRREEDFPDDHPVDLIVRPDVEDRPNHGKTKAYTGPERHWPKAVTADPTGFRFAPACDRILCMHAAPGAFAVEPQWSYMVGHPEDADRGFDGSSDVFSPGYFTLSLRGGETALLHAAIGPSSRHAAPRTLLPPTVRDAGPAVPLLEALREALRAYVVRRNESRTVIAGYPWFLDWGRDTLIVLRGLVAAGMLEESRDILRQFARFESQGTLPNRIRGSDSSDRDTSDAPLWFFAACADLDRAGDGNLASMDCGGRTLREVLLSIARHYRDGTPNGIRMDPASGLIYSPSHFTWMDTNYPAGTPRQGYPIEIQALWHAALRYLAALDPGGAWVALAEQARRSVLRLYQKPGRAFLSDCLHAAPGTPAGDAAPDDALRPNQLLAVCLGLVQDPSVASRVVDACEELLVPGALRSLADRPVAVPIAVRRDGDLLNDPLHPYWGAYRGDEDTRRKPAYHNGTAWTWLLPLYAEALLCAHGEPVRRSALALLGSVSVLLEKRCLGQIPELTDGDAPHTPRGTFAQAWGVSEHLRVLCLLRRIAPVRRS